MNTMGKWLWLVAAVGLVLHGEAAELCGKVVKVSDGDTITLLCESNLLERIRLDRIDAPEKSQPFGKRAKEHLSKLVFGKFVTVRYDKRDRYGRILGIVMLKDQEVNLSMVRDGYAWHYSYFNHTQEYSAAETEARAARKGLWTQKDPVNPYQWRKGIRGDTPRISQ